LPFDANAIGGLDNRVSSLESRTTNLEANVLTLRRDVRRSFEGSAMALAMAGAVLPADKNFALSANWGNFQGENGFAATAAARLNQNVIVHGGVGLGTNRGTVGGRAGMTFAW
jgi:hypothetical protein